MHAVFTRLNTVLLVILVLMGAAIIAILATRAGAGPLDPPGPPVSTMHTLDEVYTTANNVPQSWDQVLDSTNGAPGPINPPAGCNSDRFKCVMTYAQCTPTCITVYPAVLDRETGLVWQRSPSSTIVSWTSQLFNCTVARTGNQGGWRLPTAAELTSLMGTSPGLVPGSPFTNIQAAYYWTLTEGLETPLGAEVVDTQLVNDVSYRDKGEVHYAWCVRGATSKG